MATGPMFLTLHLKRNRFEKVADSTKKVLNLFMYCCSAGIKGIQNLPKTIDTTVIPWITSSVFLAADVYLYPQLLLMKRQNLQIMK
ncbi:hypothetical protein ACM7Q1_22980 [Paenibacillus illinoisensis]|uniref:hypothetical protein n=1 Tax=Paenibacillus illinoisensis TaxID=59845 RepID=UPI003A4E23FE